MNGKIILCPMCDRRGWSSDYWGCSNCGYEISQEFFLNELNKDYFDSKSRGDNPQLDLSFWMEEQEKLTKEMINECLPKNQYNYVVDCSQYLGIGRWGVTEYHENDAQEAELFVKRHEKELIAKGSKRDGFVYYVNMKGKVVGVKPYTYPIYPNWTGNWGTSCCPCPYPTKIKVAYWVLTKEGEYRFDGWGYFPTISHEAAHADPSVHRHPNYQPFNTQYSSGWGHDDIHKNKNREFYEKLKSRNYIEKVKDRFKELRKIQGKDDK